MRRGMGHRLVIGYRTDANVEKTADDGSEYENERANSV